MSADRTVDQVMLTFPKTLDARSSVSTVRAAFVNDHVHMVLLVDGRRLLGAITDADLPSAVDPESPAVAYSSLRGRIVQPNRPVQSEPMWDIDLVGWRGHRSRRHGAAGPEHSNHGEDATIGAERMRLSIARKKSGRDP